LPEPLRNDVEDLQTSIRFIASSPPQDAIQMILQQCRRAIIQRRTIHFGYNARFSEGETITTRSADPYGLIQVNQIWYLTAYCHLRKDRRNFRLDRMENLVVTGMNFTRPMDFKIEPSPPEDREIVVRVLFDQDTIRWVREMPSYFQTDESEQREGVVVTLRVRREEDILQWLLGWGSRARVIEPESVRQRLRAEAEAMLAQNSEIVVPNL
jgi:predicted DNA-binding transcriptional regulator YafY